MSEFDPRQPSQRFAPAVLSAAAIAGAAGIGIALSSLLNPAPPPEPKLQQPVAVRAVWPPKAVHVDPGPLTAVIRVAPGETLEGALKRAGVMAGEAHDVVQTLADAMDIVHIRAGLALRAAILKPRDPAAQPRLVSLSVPVDDITTLHLSRQADGGLQLRHERAPVKEELAVAEGRMTGSLYEAALRAGADSRIVAEAVKLFGHKLDFSRDLHPNDQFRFVFDRKRTASGKTVQTGELLYAELDAKGRTTRFYRFESGGKADYFDEAGRTIRGFLLKTPVDGAHVTSGFGFRLHPILGYGRMHPGIDFGAPSGTPVFAAGDGVVAELKRAGGYGNWLKIAHSGGWATGYGHLLRYAKGLRPGARVRQGQVVAYVGSTGLSTGPHLHYEIFHGAQKINPLGVKVPQSGTLGGRQLAAFRTAKARIDALIARAEAKPDFITTAQAAVADRRS